MKARRNFSVLGVSVTTSPACVVATADVANAADVSGCKGAMEQRYKGTMVKGFKR